MHRQSIDGLRLFFPRAWRHFETRPLSSLERQIRLQIAILLQERDHALAVFRRNLFVERAFADAFRQQLGNVAARIVHCPAFRHRIPAVQLVALHQRPARRVHFHFERHAQLPAIAEHGVMDRRKPRRARIEIVPLVEAARLAHAAGEVDVGSAADRPVAPAAALARFENRTSIPGFAQFIRRDQAGDARAQYDDLRPFSIHQPQLARFRRCFGNRQQPERLHHHERGAVPARLAHTHQKLTSGKTHAFCFPFVPGNAIIVPYPES